MAASFELGTLPPPIESKLTHEDARDLAQEAGLRKMGVRPPLGQYLRGIAHRWQFIKVLSRSRAYAKNQSYRLGQLWAVLNPLLNALIYVVIFGFLLGTRKGMDNVIAYIVTGTFLYQFFQHSLTQGAKSINNSLGLVRSMQFPRAVLPLAEVVEEVYNFLPALGVMIVVAFASGFIPNLAPVEASWYWLLIPFALVLLLAFSLGCAFLFARITTGSPDIGNFLPFALRLMMYISGVLFSIPAMVHNHVLLYLLERQPISVYLYLFRMCFLDEGTAPYKASMWAWGAGWAILFLVGGFLLFWQKEETYGRD